VWIVSVDSDSTAAKKEGLEQKMLFVVHLHQRKNKKGLLLQFDYTKIYVIC
jgi:hypothetical protein